MARGTFISVEGIDGCGKSTHCKLLAHWLRGLGHEVVVVRDPGTTPLGEKIRSVLLDPNNASMSAQCELLLYEAARAQLVSEIIAPALKRGAVVVSDRFLSSTVAYQGAGRSLSRATIEAANALGTLGYEPNLTIVLNVDVLLAQERQGAEPDRMEAQGMSFLRTVQESYLAQARQDPERFMVVSSQNSTRETFFALQRALLERLPQLVSEPRSRP